MQAKRSVIGYVSGRVQGVGFRYFVRQHARAESVCGYVSNLADGRVEFLLQGETTAVARMLELIGTGPGYSRVSELQYDETDPDPGLRDFDIR